MSEIDMVMEAYGSVMDAVCEGNHVIDKNEREGLDDKDFGLIVEEDGRKNRKYPLRMPGDKNRTKELLTKAIQFFHFCKGPYREQLAKNICRVMNEENVVIKIAKNSPLRRYVKDSEWPDGCMVVQSGPNED